MATTRETVLSRGEVAACLRTALGPVREWFNFLTDCSRARTSFEGLRLLPVAVAQDDRAWRPVYSAASVAEFIRKVLERRPELRGPHKTFKRTTVEYEESLHWKKRKATIVASRAASGHTIRPSFAGDFIITKGKHHAVSERTSHRRVS